MNIVVNQQRLSKALSTVSKAVPVRTTLPSLEGILVNATENGTILLTASDLDITIQKEIEAEFTDGVGKFLVPARLFCEIVRKMPQGDLTLELEGNKVKIISGYSKFEVVCLNHEFPDIRNVEENEKIILDSEMFKEMVKSTVFAASNDMTKGTLTGILTEVSEGNIRMVAVDGYRLALVNRPADVSCDAKFITPARVMQDISKIISDEEDAGNMRIIMDDSFTMFNIGETTVIARLLEGIYIDYESIIPKDMTIEMLTDRDVMRDSIDRASLLALDGRNNLVKFAIDNENITITSRAEIGSIREVVPISCKKGDPIEIGFNVKYIQDTLKVIDEAEILLKMESAVKPCIVIPAEGNSFLYLILPVRIS